MTTQEFKKVGRFLKEAYKELEEEALESGVDIFSEEYEEVRDRVRLAVLAKLGFTLDEYILAKEEVVSAKKKEVDTKIDTLETSLNALGEKKIPTIEEIEEVAESIVKSNLKAPQITNQIVKETIVKEPTIVKETVYETVNEEYDDAPIMAEIGYLNDRLDKIKIPEPVPQPDLEKFRKEVMEQNQVQLQESIDTLGMPDFRKLAMGLQGQIDEVKTELQANEDADIAGTISTNEVAFGTSPNTIGGSVDVTFDPATKILAVEGIPVITGPVSPTSGTIDGTNILFSFTEKPTLIVSDAVTYREDKGWSWDSGLLTVVMSIAPEYDIYGLK